jgi:pyridoxamine 5'-phosphate oxidase family protein
MIKAHEHQAKARFTEGEAEFLAESYLGRVATVSPSGEPHVVPVAYRFDGSTISFTGWNLTRSLKYRNLTSNNKVAFVVDDVVSAKPWRVRGVEIRGTAEVHEEGGMTSVTINPKRVTSWGLEK